MSIENKEPEPEVSVEQSVERVGGCRPPVLDCLSPSYSLSGHSVNCIILPAPFPWHFYVVCSFLGIVWF